MKKLFIAAIAVFAFSLANAQDMKYGVRAGLDLVSAKSESTTVDFGNGPETFGGGTVSATGFYFGGFVDFPLGDKLTLEPGLAYHAATTDGIKLNFLSVPVSFKYAVADKINILAGPSLYYNLDSESKDKTVFNLDLGGTYDITENFFIDPRYSIGLTGDVKVNHFLLGVGYKF